MSPAAGTVATAVVDDDDDEEEVDGAVAAAFGPDEAKSANSPAVELPVVGPVPPPPLPFDAPLPDLADGLAPTA